jgi:hypothetical protein
MADQTTVRPINALGGIAGNLVLSPTLAPIGPGIAAATEIFSGEIVGLDASGNMVSGSAATCVTVLGIARANFLNKTTSTPPTSGLAGAINGTILVGPYSCLSDGTVTASTPFGTDLFVVDNQTVSTSDAGGRLRAGYFVTLDTNSNPIVQFGVASPTGRAFGGGFATTPYTARVVGTSLAAYAGTGTGVLTASATGAIGAQDGITLVAGDVMFLQEGTTNLTAVDAGPWVVTNPGAVGVKYVLTRPDWWAHGGIIPLGQIIVIGGEGTGVTPAFAGTTWKTFAAKGTVIDTTAPTFWPQELLRSVTLVAGTAAAITTMPLRSASLSVISFTRTTINTATATIQYGVVPVATAGVTGTASIVPMAQVGAGTINNADISTLNMSVVNW